jgi:hypothetical protein
MSLISLFGSTQATFVNASWGVLGIAWSGFILIFNTQNHVHITRKQVMVETTTLGIPWRTQQCVRPLSVTLEQKRYTPWRDTVLIAERDCGRSLILGPPWSVEWLAEELQEALKQPLG